MRNLLFALLLIGLTASLLPADGDEETAAITAAAMSYMRAWYDGDAKKMKASLHPKLAKRSLQKGSGKRNELRLTSAADMVAYTRAGYGRGLWQKGFQIDVVILDRYDDIASVKVVAPHYYEYLHLARTEEKWVVVNTLYERKSP